jgi:hypothetical protein
MQYGNLWIRMLEVKVDEPLADIFLREWRLLHRWLGV